MSEMVDRVKKAMHRFVEGSYAKAGDRTVWRIHDSEADDKIVMVCTDRLERDQNLRDMNARAAIAAMREPSEAMIYDGVIASERQSVSIIYRAMIDGALK